MNFSGNGSNNGRERENTNTRGIQFMNKDGFYPSTLLLGFWNELVSIKFHPALEASQQTESKVFNYDKVISTALTLEKVVILLENIEKKVVPALEKGEESFAGVAIGGDSLIAVGSKVKEDGSVCAYLGLFKEIDPSTLKPSTHIYYEFRKGDVIDSYSPEDGTFETSNRYHSEFILFTKILGASCEALSNAYAHATRTVDRYFRDKLMTQVDSIAEKLGLPTSKSTGGGWSRSNKPDVFGGGNTGRSGGSRGDISGFDNAPMDNIKNMSELNDFLV